tara:strand:+ start:1313 stop:1564 length:252 start_codon:yes stop_codon:yes gene_type:complete
MQEAHACHCCIATKTHQLVRIIADPKMKDLPMAIRHAKVIGDLVERAKAQRPALGTHEHRQKPTAQLWLQDAQVTRKKASLTL